MTKKSNDRPQKSTDVNARQAISTIKKTPLKDLHGFVQDDEQRVTVLKAWEAKQPSRSTDLNAKDAIAHINASDYKDLDGFIDEDEERVTVLRAWEKVKDENTNDLGRPTKYNQEVADSIANMVAEGESTIRQICEAHDIDPQTYYNWQDDYFDFFERIKNAKEKRRDEKLAMAQKGMKQLLEGYTATERRTEAVPQEGEDGATRSVQKVTVTTKHIAPNPTMIIFTLCNLDPQHWKHISTIKHEGIPERQHVDLSNLTDEELDSYLALTQKAEGKTNGQSH